MMPQLAGYRAALLLVLAGAVIALYGALPIIGGLVAAPALAAVFRPAHRHLARRVGSSAGALILVAGLWLGLVLPGAWFLTLCARQLPAAVTDVHRHVEALRASGPVSPSLNVDSLIAKARASSAGVISATVGPALAAVAHGVMNLSIALLGLFFLLATDDAAWNAVKRRLPFTRAGSDRVTRRLQQRDTCNDSRNARICDPSRDVDRHRTPSDRKQRAGGLGRRGGTDDARPRRRKCARMGASRRRAAGPARVHVGSRHDRLGQTHPGGTGSRGAHRDFAAPREFASDGDTRRRPRGCATLWCGRHPGRACARAKWHRTRSARRARIWAVVDRERPWEQTVVATVASAAVHLRGPAAQRAAARARVPE